MTASYTHIETLGAPWSDDPDIPGFYWLAGQGGFGIMTSPAAARALAGLVATGRVPADLAELGVSAAELSPARCR